MKIDMSHVEEVDESTSIDEFVMQLNEKLKAIIGTSPMEHDDRFEGFDFGDTDESN
jgi:hypothetical protein